MCNMCKTNVNKTETFAGRMLETFNNANVGVMISLGHRAKIFDVMATKDKFSVDKLSKESNLNKRYIKEWLAAMTVANIVEYDPENRAYSLPKEHAAFLTRNAGSNNFATLFQFIPVIASVEEQLLHCFKNGGGVGYDNYYRFHEVMAEESGQHLGNNLITKILPLIDGIIDQLDKGINVLDIGCGSGTALNTLAKVFPNSNFTGIDLCKEPIRKAIKVAKNLNLENVSFLRLDGSNFHFDTKFDFITTFDTIHDQARPDKVLKNIYNSLTDEGTYLMMDIYASSYLEDNIDHPLAPALYSMSTAHSMTVSLAQKGMGLGSMWGYQQATKMLSNAGFSDIKIELIPEDMMNAYYIAKK